MTKNTTGLIGVIVPVYKVEKHITECIESILAQTYTKFRLILVDDGTPDNAGKICDEYAKKDPRITVIHQENAGVTRARARGVEEAKDCEFITFVDGDDILLMDALQEYQKKMDDSTDIVMNTTYCTETNKCLYFNSYEMVENKIDLNTFIKKLVICYGGSPWGKLFRNNLFNSKTFDIPRTIVYGEDVIMNLRLTFNSNKNIRIITHPYYFYRQNNYSSACKEFKITLEHEELFYDALKLSIPQEYHDTYIGTTIKNRLVSFNLFWGYKYFVKGMKKRKFYQELKKDINIHGYKLSPIDEIIFEYENPIIRFLSINIKKVKNLLSYKN